VCPKKEKNQRQDSEESDAESEGCMTVTWEAEYEDNMFVTVQQEEVEEPKEYNVNNTVNVTQ
jgi:hypothetical protein